METNSWEGNSLYPQKLFGWRMFKAIPVTNWTDRPIKKGSWVLSPIGGSDTRVYPDLIDGTWTQDAKCTLIYTEHESPATDCSCGYWCLYNLRGLMFHPVSGYLFDTLDYYVGYIEVSGKVVIGTMGFRAQKMRLKGLLSMKTLHGYGLKWRYFTNNISFLTIQHSSFRKMYDTRFPNVPRLEYKEAVELSDSHARNFLEESDREHNGTLDPCYCSCDSCYTYYTTMRKEELRSFDNTESVRYTEP